MTDVTNKLKRPSSITLISVLVIYSGILSLYFAFSAGNQISGPRNIAFYIIGGIVFLVCGVGFWLMKKWAVYAYTIFGIVDQIALLLIGRWNILALLILIIVIYIGYKHLSKMS